MILPTALINSPLAIHGNASPRSPSSRLTGLPRPRAGDVHRRAGPALLFLELPQELLALDGDRLHGTHLAADSLSRGPALAGQPRRRTAQPPLRLVPAGLLDRRDELLSASEHDDDHGHHRRLSLDRRRTIRDLGRRRGRRRHALRRVLPGLPRRHDHVDCDDDSLRAGHLLLHRDLRLSVSRPDETLARGPEGARRAERADPGAVRGHRKLAAVGPGGQRVRQAGQPGQERLSREHEPRAPHAAERDPRLQRDARRGCGRRWPRRHRSRPAEDPDRRQAPARVDQRRPRPLQDRGRKDAPVSRDVRGQDRRRRSGGHHADAGREERQPSRGALPPRASARFAKTSPRSGRSS